MPAPFATLDEFAALLRAAPGPDEGARAAAATRNGRLTKPPGALGRLEEVGAGRAPMLHLRWEERGGPQLEGPPRRRGFGLKLLETGLPAEIGGLVSVEFRPGGLVCEIEAPLKAAASAVPESV